MLPLRLTLPRTYLLTYFVQTGPGAHPATCTMGTGFFPGGKVQPGRAADHSPPSSAVVMEE